MSPDTKAFYIAMAMVLGVGLLIAMTNWFVETKLVKWLPKQERPWGAIDTRRR